MPRCGEVGVFWKAIQLAYRVARRIELALWTFVITGLITANSLVSGRRMSHENGITCRGKITLLPELDLPSHAFFKPGRTFPCRLRHGAASWLDDAKLVVRSASLKFADHRYESPLDLMLNSGEVPLFWNARTFLSFMIGTIGGRGKHWLRHLRKYPQAMVGGGSSVRRNPACYTGMSYNSKTCSGFVSEDGDDYYCRFRIIPAEGWSPESETGLPEPEDYAHPWLQNPLPRETHCRNYLKKQLVKRLHDEGVAARYRLQIQLRPWNKGESPQWVSSAWPWDETHTPWRDLAEIEITEVLDHAEALHTAFHLGHHPPSLPLPKARSIDDPHSLNHLRHWSILARHARELHYKIRGTPDPIPDSRHSKDWIAVPPMSDPPGE